MRVLVTGATGRVGSRLVPRLIEHNYDVRVLLRHEAQAGAFESDGAEIAPGDLLQPDTLPAAVAGMDAIVHVAAFFRGATEAEAHAVNLDGTLALARAALDAGVPHFINISTGLVYGPGRGRPAREDDEPQPAAERFYPVSKLKAERALAECYPSDHAALSILRLAFVYGDGDPHLDEALNLTKTWPAARRLHLVHHADVAQAIMLTLEKPQGGMHIYNVADDAPVTMPELRRRSGAAEPVQVNNPPMADPWEGVMDTSLIKSELGFQPIYPTLADADRAQAL